MPKIIDPSDKTNMLKPIWCIYYVEDAPIIIGCIISHSSIGLVLWGYSVYRNIGDYRTYGQNLDKFIERNSPMFYESLDDVLEDAENMGIDISSIDINKNLIPTKSAIRKLKDLRRKYNYPEDW